MRAESRFFTPPIFMKGMIGMDWKKIMSEDAVPLETLKEDGGFCGIFRTIGFVGDSLSSGEFESFDENENRNYHDMFDYSWGQYIARAIGAKAYNFSRGGMTAEEYCEGFADNNRMWDSAKACQAYVIALGVNDISKNGSNLGDISDIDLEDYKNNKKTFVGYYAQIIQRYKKIQPRAKFFLMTIPHDGRKDKERTEAEELHAALIYKLAETFSNTYVLDFRKYAPEYGKEFYDAFMLGGHMNPMGYMLTAKMVMSYIDFIIRHNPKDFKEVPFIGTDLKNLSENK